LPTGSAKKELDVRKPPKKRGPFCVWHGLTFGSWLRLLSHGPPIDAGHLLRAATITVVSLINSLESAVESLVFGARLARLEITKPPLFILGHWRSGTTLLHNLLTLDPQFAYPNLYQVLFSGHFLTTERLVTRLTGWMIPKTRLIDNMPAGWNMTQEDEIALLLTTGMSPYLMLAFQGRRSRYDRYFSLSELTPEERETWKRTFLLFLKKLTLRSNKPIVLKSPSHTYRIPLLLEMFPQAKFVYIIRDPYAVLNSSLHLRRTLFTENSLAAPNFAGLEEDTFLTYEDCIRTYERTKSLIPDGQLHEMRFENLEADPLGEMRTLYESLHMSGWEVLEPILRAKLPELASHSKNKYAADDAFRRRIYHRLRWVFELYGYPHGLDGRCDVPRLTIAG
jgi:hypothetical protein